MSLLNHDSIVLFMWGSINTPHTSFFFKHFTFTVPSTNHSYKVITIYYHAHPTTIASLYRQNSLANTLFHAFVPCNNRHRVGIRVVLLSGEACELHRSDIISVFKIRKSKITRGHNITLVKEQSRLDARKYSICRRTITVWNK